MVPTPCTSQRNDEVSLRRGAQQHIVFDTQRLDDAFNNVSRQSDCSQAGSPCPSAPRLSHERALAATALHTGGCWLGCWTLE